MLEPRQRGTEIEVADRRRSRIRLLVLAGMTRIVSRLDFAAPCNTLASPPVSKARTRCFRIETRTLRIGLWIKRSSRSQERLPKSVAFQPAPRRAQAMPFRPFLAHQLFGSNHDAAAGDAPFAFKAVSGDATTPSCSSKAGAAASSETRRPFPPTFLQRQTDIAPRPRRARRHRPAIGQTAHRARGTAGSEPARRPR